MALSFAAAVGGLLDGAASSAAASCSATGHHACQIVPMPCSQLRSNHPGSATDVLDTPLGPAFRDPFVRFAQDFRRATAALNFSERHERLSALRMADGPWSWPMYNGTVLLGNFLNFKVPILEAFERSMHVQHALWRPGMSLLDVGGALGLQAAYLAAAHGVKATVYEIPFTSNCPIILQSPFRVNFFQGTIPEPSRSHDAVSFMNVLHHAANLTVPLLRQAANIARHFILITEDIDGVTNRNLLHAHDPQGIFRSDPEWKQLFERELPEFALRRSGGLMKRRPCVEGARIPRGPNDYSTAPPPMVCSSRPPQRFYRFYALERMQSQHSGHSPISNPAGTFKPTGSKRNVGTQSEVRCASCKRERGSGLQGRLSEPTTVLPTTRWREACTLEQSRAAAFLLTHQALNTPHPQVDTQLLDASLEQTGKTLRQLLHSRGSLCSDNVPCSVDIVDNSSLSVCLPVLSKPSSDPKMCELAPSALPGQGFHMRKACSQGTRTRRCFEFNPGAIRAWIAAMRLKVHAPSSVSLLPPENLNRCAVVLSGHVLRCSSQPWAAVIDSPFYDAIFRTNVYPVAHPDCPVSTKLAEVAGGGKIAGSRTDFGHSGCRAAAQPGVCEPRFCMNGSKVYEWSMSVRHNPTLGLGLGHSGGLLVDAALAHCGEVHVFGAGLFSRGPGFDAVMQHWYDSDISVDGCTEQCSLDGLGKGDRSRFFSRFQSSLCRPSSPCQSPQAKALPASENHGDFFYLSELRFPLYHALGLINWIWW